MAKFLLFFEGKEIFCGKGEIEMKNGKIKNGIYFREKKLKETGKHVLKKSKLGIEKKEK